VLRATRPSLDPETRARKSSLNSAGDTPLGCQQQSTLGGDAFEAGIAVGQTRESGRNRHRGWHESGVARLAACHRSQKEKRGRKTRKMVEAIVPARLESSGLVARMSEMQLQKSVGEVWSQIRSANALSKRAVRVE